MVSVGDTLSQAGGRAADDTRVNANGPAEWGTNELHRNTKECGNEAKKYLKTKEVTFLNAANYARFTRIFVQIERKRSKNRPVCAKRTGGLRVGNNDRQSASARLRFFAALKTCRGRACPTRSIRDGKPSPYKRVRGGPEPFAVILSAPKDVALGDSEGLRMTALEGFSVHGKKVLAPG